MVLQNPKDHCHVYKRLPMCHIFPRSNCTYSRSGNSLLFSDHILYAFLIPLLQYPHFIFLYIALKKNIPTQYIYESRRNKLPVQELRWLVASLMQTHRYKIDVTLRHCLLLLQFSPYHSASAPYLYTFIYHQCYTA